MTNRCRQYLATGALDLDNDTLRFALYNGSSNGPNTTVYTATDEASGTGYTAGGAVAANNATTLDTTNNVLYLDCDNVQWTSSTITATDALLYDDTVSSPAANPSLGVYDFGGSVSSNGGTFSLLIPTAAYNTALWRIA